MVHTSDVLIRVHDSWSGWRSAEIRLADLEDVHWWQPCGAPHRLVHAFVRCADLRNGDLEHRCDGSMPHRVRICVLKHYAAATIYHELASRADRRATAASTATVDLGGSIPADF